MAAVTGMFAVNNPNNNHSNVPNAKREYIDKDIPEVSFVRMVFMACGKKEVVVQTAAAKPIIVILFTSVQFLVEVKVAVIDYKLCNVFGINVSLS